MRMRCLWCAVATSALAVAVSGFAGCSEGAKPAPAPVPAPVVSAGEAPSAPAAGGVPKPGKAAPGASASPAVPTGAALAAPAAAAPAAPAAAAPAVKGPTVKGPPKGKVPAKLQGKTPPAPEPF